MNEIKELEAIKTQLVLLAEKAQALEEGLRRRGKKSLLNKLESAQRHWYIGNDLINGLSEKEARPLGEQPNNYNQFKSEEQAKAYANAINTFLALRHQPGTVPAKQDVLQWVITLEGDFEFVVDKGWWTLEDKLGWVFPCFETQEDAINAINAIGQDALAHMIKTFGHFQEDA